MKTSDVLKEMSIPGQQERKLSLRDCKRSSSWSKYIISSGEEIKEEGEDEWRADMSQLLIGYKFAAGRHSRIYRGVYKQMDVAIKLMRQPEEDRKLAALVERQFVSEVSLLLRLHHPNIITFPVRANAANVGEIHAADWVKSASYLLLLQIALAVKLGRINCEDDESSIYLHDYQLFQPLNVCWLFQSSCPSFVAACKRPPVFCIMTEYLAGGSLRQYLHNQEPHSLPLEWVLKFALDIAHGMQYLHSCGILHRDLKSDNLLLGEDMHVRVADFGISCLESQCGSGKGFTSTYRWMAPEMIKEKRHTKKVDVYSFGIVFWELLTALTPFYNMTPEQAAFAVSQKVCSCLCFILINWDVVLLFLGHLFCDPKLVVMESGGMIHSIELDPQGGIIKCLEQGLFMFNWRRTRTVHVQLEKVEHFRKDIQSEVKLRYDDDRDGGGMHLKNTSGNLY
ncbi:hypothetical protein ACLOJK_001420 [Asimina triloba]